MIGDYTKVPLRRGERWTGARMPQGRVLLDHEWNLNLDATDRTARWATTDIIGPSGVQMDSDAFKVGLQLDGANKVVDLTLPPGRMWVAGMMAYAPTAFTYSGQDQIDPLPTPKTGKALVYLDVFSEHIQPPEDMVDLIDPGLAPVDSCGRTRVGYRVRCVATTATSCDDALKALGLAGQSTGTMTIKRTTAPPVSDPCSPPADPRGVL